MPAGGGLISSIVGRHVGPYRILARLGGGAMATVYKAADTRDGATAALKVLLPDADATVRERFRLEAQTARALEHPHIVRTLAVGGPDGATAHVATSLDATYIAMELVEGEDLGSLLDRVHVLTATDAAALLAPVARALAYAHSRNVVHRDVKPSNILLKRAAPGQPGSARITVLDDPVVPLLSDFGIARALDAPELTSAGRTIGTPAYMSPEQCAGTREIDGRADIYALGAVLYRALVGRSPYQGTTTQILYAHVYDPLTLPEEVLRTLPPVLVEVLRRALAKEPDDRYATADEMAEDLDVGSGRAGLGERSRATAAVLPTPPEFSTMTMPDLAAAPDAATTSRPHVLVPAPARQFAPPPSPDAPSGAGAPQAPEPQAARGALPAVPHAPPRAAAAGMPPRRVRWRGPLVGLSLALPLFLILGTATAALLDMGPWRARPEATAPSVAAASPETTPGEIAADADASPASGAPADSTPVAPLALTPTTTSTPTPVPSATPVATPAGDINAYWADAQDAFDARDWQEAESWLTLVQRIDPGFEQAPVTAMRYTSAMQLGAGATRSGDFGAARDAFARAVALAPDQSSAQALLRTTQEMIAAEANGGEAALEQARGDLRTAHTSYGAALVSRSQFCDASDHLDAALALVADTEAERYATEIRGQCALLLEAQADQKTLESLTGRLLYSTEVGDGQYRIYLLDAASGARSTWVIDHGRQAAMAPDGLRIAFHSTRNDAIGLAAFDLNAGLDPAARSLLYTQEPGDASDSPPTWNQSGTRLIFARTDPATGRSRIMTMPADGNAAPQEITLGKTPAWSWANDLVAYNGVDTNGANPGLYLMRADGTDPVTLTGNGNDIRPAWAPDGGTVYFMSNGRSGNWDVYRVGLPSGTVLQMTDIPTQEGLPAVSPDGKFVAFVSDRGGTWNIWVKPTESSGSRVLLLAPVEGTLTNWLEHNLQWIP